MLGNLFALYALHGKSLMSFGIANAALPIEVAKNYLYMFQDAELLILGGDIYNGLDSADFYADWAYDGGSYKESTSEASSFLSKFSHTNEELFVAFVVKPKKL